MGSKAPNFNLLGLDNISSTPKPWKLSDFKGNWLVIYFYPKDYTNGCTLEARGFEENSEIFKKLDCMILGISSDSLESHKGFCTSDKLKYPLLSDPDGSVSKAYKSWDDPYSSRNTFLINPEGLIEYRWLSVSPRNHANEVIKQIEFVQSKA